MATTTVSKPKTGKPHSYKIIGLPGTGKTYRLISMLSNFISDGYDISEIIFCSHTNAAVNELKSRISSRLKISRNKLSFVKTMHSLCHQMLRSGGISIQNLGYINEQRKLFYKQFITNHHRLFDVDHHELLKIKIDTDEPQTHFDELRDIRGGDLFHLREYILTTFPDQFSDLKLSLSRLKKFLLDQGNQTSTTNQVTNIMAVFLLEYETFAEKHNLMDFSDLLQQAFQRKLVPKGCILIIDEFQDLSPLQFRLFETWSKYMEIIVVAGDPHQAIYGFQFASPKFINDFQATETILLDKSYRLPNEIIKYTRKQMESVWLKSLHNAETINHAGSVERLSIPKLSTDHYNSTFVLVRSNAMIFPISTALFKFGIFNQTEHPKYRNPSLKLFKILYPVLLKLQSGSDLNNDDLKILLVHIPRPNRYEIQQGNLILNLVQYQNVEKLAFEHLGPYSSDIFIDIIGDFDHFMVKLMDRLNNNHQASLIRAGLRAQKPLKQILRKMNAVIVKTIHSAKGEEADLVVVIDHPTIYEQKGIEDPEEERRIWYVGITRAKRKLVITSFERKGQSQRTKYLPAV